MKVNWREKYRKQIWNYLVPKIYLLKIKWIYVSNIYPYFIRNRKDMNVCVANNNGCFYQSTVCSYSFELSAIAYYFPKKSYIDTDKEKIDNALIL